MAYPSSNLVKTAIPTPEQSERIKQDAAKIIAQLPLAALAMGAVGRGIFGLRDLFTTQTLQPPGIVPGTQFIGMPRLDREKEKQKKHAADPTEYKPSSHALGRVADLWGKPLYEWLLKGPGRTMFGRIADGARNVSGVPYTYSLGLPLAAVGFGAGYKGMDAVLDHRRHAERKRELEKTKAEYIAMLQGKTAAFPELHQTENLNPVTRPIYEALVRPGGFFGPKAAAAPIRGVGPAAHMPQTRIQLSPPTIAAPPATTPSAKEAAAMLDELAEKTAAAIEKTAEDPPAPPSALDWVPGGNAVREYGPHVAGIGINAYLATALLSALGAGALSYGHFRGQSKRKTLEEALRRRAATDQPGPAMVYTEQ
jgi:hypothetical protein